MECVTKIPENTRSSNPPYSKGNWVSDIIRVPFLLLFMSPARSRMTERYTGMALLGMGGTWVWTDVNPHHPQQHGSPPRGEAAANEHYWEVESVCRSVEFPTVDKRI